MPAVRVKTLYLKTPRPEPIRYRRSPPFQDGSDLRIRTLHLPPLTKPKSRPHLQESQSLDYLGQLRHSNTPRDKGKKPDLRSFMPLDIVSVRTVKKTAVRPTRKRPDLKEPTTLHPSESIILPLNPEYPPISSRISLSTSYPPPRPASPLELPVERTAKQQGKEEKNWGLVQEEV